jgi:hypothetical protein
LRILLFGGQARRKLATCATARPQAHQIGQKASTKFPLLSSKKLLTSAARPYIVLSLGKLPGRPSTNMCWSRLICRLVRIALTEEANPYE